VLPVKRRVFISFLSLHNPNNRFECISIFYLPLFNSVDIEKLSLRRKNIGGLLPPAQSNACGGILFFSQLLLVFTLSLNTNQRTFKSHDAKVGHVTANGVLHNLVPGIQKLHLLIHVPE
jgi:hypothetical protein